MQLEDSKADTTDIEYGRAPLSWAVKNGHEEVVKWLSEREDINPNTVGTEYDQTPLLWVAEGGYDRAVEPLLERDDVNPDISDLSGETAPELTVSRGHTRVVELLSPTGPSDFLPGPSRPTPSVFLSSLKALPLFPGPSE